MPRPPVPEITKQSIKKARAAWESVNDLMARFKLSRATVYQITKGIDPKVQSLAQQIVKSGIAAGVQVTVDGIDLTQHLKADIDRLSDAMDSAQPKSLEGVAAAKIKMIQCYLQLNPPTLADFVDQLIARPDFDPGEFVRLLKDRYDKAS